VNKLKDSEKKVCPSFPYTQKEFCSFVLQQFFAPSVGNPAVGISCYRVPNPEFFVSEPPWR
jgi:hypothetical protein